MRKILLITFLLFSIISFSQVDRRIGRGQYERSPRKTNKKVNFTEQTIDFFKKEINIDAFQEAVLRNLINDYEQNIKKTSQSDITDLEKRDQYASITENFKSELKTILSEEQFSKYEGFMKEKKEK